MRNSRSGFTLIELLITLVIVSFVAMGIQRIFVTQQRLTVAQVEQANLQANMRLGGTALLGELLQMGPGSPGGNDLVAMGASSLTYRSIRGEAIACQVSATQVRILQTPSYLSRPITTSDSILLFVENSPSMTSDDSWIAIPITAVNNASTCGASVATALTTTVATPLANIVLNAPVHIFEVMQIAQVTSGGENWLGARSVSAGQALQPVVGPLATTGLSFAYFDSLGNTTATAANVRSIRVTLRGVSEDAVRQAGTSSTVQNLRDSVVFQLSVRNSPLP
ncbi:MAG: prepilin-type N-terminal cleavage/methylation domain-containing protein [Gemmatimonadota bacterium]|nr:prepilin-type N-terminal cleavage/methylation domain-containing protein [Gemmatimonadota bacterium]MDH5282575.1 prepilin-type N-terminal cleavage/methylation domain-containing protein [Gemmatimonadota bacterium]